MLLVTLLGGLGLLALPALARRGGRRLHPAEWTPLCVFAVAGGASVVEVSLVVYAVPTLVGSSGIPRLAELCDRMLAPLAPGGPAVGWAAAAMATVLAVLAAVGWSRTRRVTTQMQVEPGVGRHAHYRLHELVVLPTTQPVAISVPVLSPDDGRGQIVVSDGLLDALAPREVDAVLAHEAAHLELGHHRYLAVAAAVDQAFAWLPVARRSTATLRLALERWADEEAASRHGRGTVRDALLAVTATLLGTDRTAPAGGPAVSAFSAAETIVERLDALDGDRPDLLLGPRLQWYPSGAVLGPAMAAVLWCWVNGAGGMLAIAGRCA